MLINAVTSTQTQVILKTWVEVETSINSRMCYLFGIIGPLTVWKTSDEENKPPFALKEILKRQWIGNKYLKKIS